MKHMLWAALVLGSLPAVASAGGRYDGYGHGSNGFFGISLGFGGDNWFGGISYSGGGYYPRYGYSGHYPAYRPYYYVPVTPPVVVDREPAYVDAPVVLVQPRRTYYAPARPYYTAPRTYEAPSGRYYYGR